MWRGGQRPNNAAERQIATTLRRLAQVLEAKGLTIFASTDYAAGAAGVGLTRRPTMVVTFGNPIGGTPLMQAAGIDLPLKALVWQIAGLSGALASFARHATSGD